MRPPVLALLLCMFAASPAVAAQHLYFTSLSSNALQAFDVGADGSLTANGGTVPVTNPVPVIPSPDGAHVYVGAGDNTVRIFAVSGSGGLGTETSVALSNVSPTGMAIAPDGDHLYLLNQSANNGVVFDIAADGGLVNGRVFPTGSGPAAIALTPDGAHAYVGNSLSGTIDEFSIDASGDLTSIGTIAAAQPTVPAVSPDGRHLYVGHQTNGSIRIFDIQDDGTLAPNAVPSVQAGSGVWHVLASPARAQLFAGDSATSTGLYGWAIGSDGALTAMPGSPFSGTGVTGGLAMTADGAFLFAARMAMPVIRRYAVGDSSATELGSTPDAGEAHPFSLAMSPDQPPSAALTVTAGTAGSASSFDASASTDSDGTIARYDWVFGDGATASTTSPTTTHAYASAGSYSASVTVVDDLGCSTARTHNGQYVQCNGGPGARSASTVGVAAAPSAPSSEPPPATPPAVAPELTGLAVAPRCARRRAVAAGKGHVFSYRLNIAATVRYVITRRDHSPKWPVCPRPGGATPDTYSAVGSGDVSASAGEQSTPLASISRTIRSRRSVRAGRVRIPLARIAQAASKLGYGTYVLTVTASAGGMTSDPASVRFWVLADRVGGQ